jgi:L-fuconolactonase
MYDQAAGLSWADMTGAIMPYGGNDWLALMQEPILEPELPICDPHHHFWDFRLARIPYQRYLLHELMADVGSGHNVRSTVFIEARAMYRADGPAEMRPVGEVEFVQGLAAASASGLYGPCRAAASIVGHADLKLGDRVESVVEALQAVSPNRFRGIRHICTWHPDPRVESREREGVLSTAEFRTGAKILARKGLSLDTIVCFPQLPELAAFARALPDLPIILNHLGGLNRTGPFAGRDDEVMPAWKSGMADIAQCPNVMLKLGGIGMPRFGFDWHMRETPIGSGELASAMAPLLSWCIDRFGPERVMFESNFPVDKVSFSYPVLFNAFKRFSEPYSPGERAALFHDTAVRAYRIDEP